MRHNLINARKAKDLTQAQLGKMLKVSDKTISAMEQGRVTGKPDTWDLLAEILGADSRQLREITEANSSSLAGS